ncbi:MAG: hypothetical protein IT484_02375 [Gammaproteobacteria bacterium]|nr:hypothetical protein [Gammaproteobacteria bacterium]
MSGATSRRVALGALVVLMLLTALPFTAMRGLTLLPLAAVLVAGAWPSRTWAVATGSVMLGYFSWGVMDILTNPAGRLRAVAYALLTVTVFFGAFDSVRRP